MRTKYSKSFNRDFSFYLSVRYKFNFAGVKDIEVSRDSKAISGKQAFHIFDSQGKLVPTKHPHLLKTLVRAKKSIDLHIEMYAEDLNSGLFL